ncbi:hypothetical protein MATL_G00022850 [Megalops atlanticus]|uniref:SAM domain-containing protein n=1 Tax=Megalops atlanticus TaxID=7932 RepID=A0A9D3TJE3_MEGAT|nr:hypothetical protein MATL_G00022850 [Megalops atlanticus]
MTVNHSDTMCKRYSFLRSEAKERVAWQQEVIHRKNMARLEINTILQQKELERGQQRGLVATQIPIMHQDHGVPPNAMAFWVLQCLPAGHLPSNIFVHHTTLKANDLQESPEPYPPIRSLQRKRGGDHAPSQRTTCTPPPVPLPPSCCTWAIQDQEMDFTSNRELAVQLQRWKVEDVCSFIRDIPGCSQYAGGFRDHALDREALPLLTAHHLLHGVGPSPRDPIPGAVREGVVPRQGN